MTKTARLLTALLIAASAGTALADTVGVHTVSAHDRSRPDGQAYAWATPGLYYRADSGLTVGTLRNSYGHRGVYGAWTWSTDETRAASVAVSAGLTTGYDIAPVVPMLIPSVAVRISDQLAARVLVMPRMHAKQHATAVSLAFEFSMR